MGPCSTNRIFRARRNVIVLVFFLSLVTHSLVSNSYFSTLAYVPDFSSQQNQMDEMIMAALPKHSNTKIIVNETAPKGMSLMVSLAQLDSLSTTAKAIEKVGGLSKKIVKSVPANSYAQSSSKMEVAGDVVGAESSSAKVKRLKAEPLAASQPNPKPLLASNNKAKPKSKPQLPENNGSQFGKNHDNVNADDRPTR
jgi:hypothetical protein